MVQMLQAREVNLAQLEETFGLIKAQGTVLFEDQQFPALSESEMAMLDGVKAEFAYLSIQDVLEPIVKMVVLSPLLRLAGFFRSPFRITAEKSVELVTEDEGFLVRGLIDLLVFDGEIWVVTIEAKRAEYSLKAALPQVLAYMLSSPNSQKKVYGFVTNGSEFRFIQLEKEPTPIYSLSDVLVIDRGKDLYRVAQLLKELAQAQ
jgi:Type I restriction enzyme R protein N terminus (HSDR_N)